MSTWGMSALNENESHTRARRARAICTAPPLIADASPAVSGHGRHVLDRTPAPVRDEPRLGQRSSHPLEVTGTQAHGRDVAATGRAGQRGPAAAGGVEPD